MSLIKEVLQIRGMTCVGCQNKLEKKLKDLTGVREVKVSYSNGTVEIIHEVNVSIDKIVLVIEGLGYEVNDERSVGRVIGLLSVIIFIYMYLEYFDLFNLLTPSQLAAGNMSYGMLFILGFVTSIHCIAMCGGLNLSQCITRENQNNSLSKLFVFKSPFLYNLGRVISYTVIGFMVGALGSVIDFSIMLQGILKLIVGIFMLIMGINMLEIFPVLRKLNLRLPEFITQKVNKEKVRNNSPLIVGLLNGFMPCGPLQAMQLYALSTGSPITGAISMFLFSIGTVPLMFGLGALSSVLSKKFTKKAMTVGAVLVVVLGLLMITQGMNLSEMAFGVNQEVSDEIPADKGISEVQVINSKLTANTYPAITVKVGVPVKWIIEAPQGTINGCNDRFFIGEYGIEHKLIYGENIIEFMPTKTGTFKYSCWMGMITSTITVED